MTRSALAGWILSLPFVNGVPRPAQAALYIADAALTTSDPFRWAATLDTFAALESAYRVDAAGDCAGLPPGSPRCRRLDEHGKPWAASCGMLQTPCAQTPSDAAGQLAVALSIFVVAAKMCPTMPLNAYATGKCGPWRGQVWREWLIARALRVPYLGEAENDHDGTPETIDTLPEPSP